MNRDMIRVFIELAKVRITFAVSLTTIAGFLLAGGGFGWDLILTVLGIFLLACGSSVVNHYQDSELDMKMERTSGRPIPAGKISPGGALTYAIVLILAGSLLIYYGAGFLGLQLGLLALIWYNAIYTPLKRRTAFAVVPGSVIGAIPPLVGWVAAGGSLADPRALILAFFFFIWQVPHFWLLMLRYGEEYEEAGYPSITGLFDDKQIRYITFLWTFATAVSSLMIPVFGLIHSVVIAILIFLSAAWLVFVFAGMLKKDKGVFNPSYYFMRINYFVLAMIIFISVDAIIGH